MLASEARICLLTVPEIVCALSGPMTSRPTPCLTLSVVPVATVMLVIAEPSFFVNVPGSVTGLETRVANSQLLGVTAGEPELSV